jgi:hypothetical protein
MREITCKTYVMKGLQSGNLYRMAWVALAAVLMQAFMAPLLYAATAKSGAMTESARLPA